MSAHYSHHILCVMEDKSADDCDYIANQCLQTNHVAYVRVISDARHGVSNHPASIVCSTVCSCKQQRKRKDSVRLALMGTRRWPVGSPKKGQLWGKPCYIMTSSWRRLYIHHTDVILLHEYFIRWLHHERDGFSNHQPFDCLLNCLLKRR